uniref:Uncharacterized protein n=1 Tax=Anopheles atroparvus TaxID=41427 RepID=A0A182JB56_ANOAO
MYTVRWILQRFASGGTTTDISCPRPDRGSRIGHIEALRLRKVSVKSCNELKERDILDLGHTPIDEIVHLDLHTLSPANEQFLRNLSAFLPHLKRIKLRVARIMSLPLFKRCLNIRSLTLFQCTYENIHDLQLEFSHLKGLENLNLQRTFDIGDNFFNRTVHDGPGSVGTPYRRIVRQAGKQTIGEAKTDS